MENQSKRIAFIFSQKDLKNLEKLTKLKGYLTLGDAVRDSIKNMVAIEKARNDNGSRIEVMKIQKDGKKILLQIE